MLIVTGASPNSGHGFNLHRSTRCWLRRRRGGRQHEGVSRCGRSPHDLAQSDQRKIGDTAPMDECKTMLGDALVELEGICAPVSMLPFATLRVRRRLRRAGYRYAQLCWTRKYDGYRHGHRVVRYRKVDQGWTLPDGVELFDGNESHASVRARARAEPGRADQGRSAGPQCLAGRSQRGPPQRF